MSSMVNMKEAAAILGCSHSTVWRMVKRGTLKPSLVVNKHAYFSRDYIELTASLRLRNEKAA